MTVVNVNVSLHDLNVIREALESQAERFERVGYPDPRERLLALAARRIACAAEAADYNPRVPFVLAPYQGQQEREVDATAA